MKYYCLNFLFFLLSLYSFPQTTAFSKTDKSQFVKIEKERNKPIIDSAAIHDWVSLGSNQDLKISNDGRYITYVIMNQPVDGQTMVVQSVDGSWKKEFINASKISFSNDSKLFMFRLNDSLCFLSLRTFKVTYISNVLSYKIPNSDAGEWIAWQVKNDKSELVARNILTGKELHYSAVNGYSFNNQGTVLLIQTQSKEGDLNVNALQWLDLSSGIMNEIFSVETASISSANFDTEGNQLVFAVQEKNTAMAVTTLWYYKRNMQKAVLKVTNGSPGIDPGFFVQPSPKFSVDGNYIYFSLLQMEMRRPNPNAVKVNVWNYQDVRLQSLQLHDPAKKTYTAVISADVEGNEKAIRLNGELEDVTLPNSGDFALLTKHSIEMGDRFWLRDTDVQSNWVISLKDGTRSLLKEVGSNLLYFSPDAKYLIYFDTQKENYFSYEVNTGKAINISSAVPRGLLVRKDDFFKLNRKAPAGRVGWVKKDSGLLVSDNYDIWLLDPTGKNAAVNITNGYGYLNHIKFGVLNTGRTGYFIEQDSILLAAYNTRTKFTGFYQVSLSKKRGLEFLTMGPYIYHLYSAARLFVYNDDMEPQKSKDANLWIVRRISFNSSPNYFITKDFKSFKALTDIQPQTKFNWLTAELINFKQLDGTAGQGILYKPENFDPNKRYPLIINYYEQKSHHLYDYPYPGIPGHAEINIPWFVSRGYLVFTPDTYFNKLMTGPAVYNTVIAATRYLSSYRFVDSKRIGIAGHSFGGYLTNYLVTHTDLFAAAFEGAGVSDLISASLQLVSGDGSSRLALMFESNAHPYPSLWKNSNPWIKNSPIFNAGKVTTPLMMFHCRPDGGVPWEQAVEMFVALRYLNKKAWLIEYDDGGHAVEGENAVDLNTRNNQFFDHYLKGAPATVWMTRGIPTRLKQIETGYAYDPSGNCGKDCKVCEYWNEKFKKDSAACWKEIEERKEEEHWQ